MGDTPLHPPHSQSRPLRKAAGPYPMAWVLLFTAAGVAVARYATLPAGFLAAAFAAATLMAFITYRRRIGNGYIAIALLLLGMALPALRPHPAYGPAGTNRLHEAASERIRRLHLPPDAEAVALAMAAGDQTELTPERRAPYARTGTAHVLAVSGLHTGIVFVVVNCLLGWLPLVRRGHLLKNLLATAAVWLFVAAAGFPPSAVRAAVMCTFLQAALASASEYVGMNALATAAFGMLLWNPAWIGDPGFLLSFLAVAGILAWGVPLCRRCRTRRRWLNALIDAYLVGLVATIATAPLVSHLFGIVPLAGLIVNPVAIALAGVVVFGGTIWMLAPVGAAAPLVGWVTGQAAGAINLLARATASLPGGAADWRLGPAQTVALYGLFLLATLALWCREPKKSLPLRP